MKKIFQKIFMVLFSSNALFAEHATHMPSNLTLAWTVPFFLTLLSIALGPMLFHNFWHKHYGKICGTFAFITIASFFYNDGAHKAAHVCTHSIISEYIPFILMIGVLFVVTGGINIKIFRSPTPANNTAVLAFATLLASVVGTTGAAMIFIKPLIAMNKERKYKTHTIIFFILLVCNIGGCLSAIGDPPLFVGFLYGVPFFWPAYALFLPFITLYFPLLLIYYLLDKKYFKTDNKISSLTNHGMIIKGKHNIVILFFAVFVVVFSNIKIVTDFMPDINIFDVLIEGSSIVRSFSLIILAFISFVFTPSTLYINNDFSWAPLKEIAKIFLVIFITADPVIRILRDGDTGALSIITNLVNNDKTPIPLIYFWCTGLLSSFLDNAPTYMVFFNIAGGKADVLCTTFYETLMAISAGSVFMGSLTYIGNAPNFLVKSTAQRFNIVMPGFFKYTFFASCLLLPLFLVQSLIFFY